MVTIFKYPLYEETGFIQDKFIIEMPNNSQILTVQLQGSIPCIWVMVDTDLPIVKRNFVIKGTGHEIDATERINYIGTFQEWHGQRVWHLFEQI